MKCLRVLVFVLLIGVAVCSYEDYYGRTFENANVNREPQIQGQNPGHVSNPSYYGDNRFHNYRTDGMSSSGSAYPNDQETSRNPDSYDTENIDPYHDPYRVDLSAQRKNLHPYFMDRSGSHNTNQYDPHSSHNRDPYRTDSTPQYNYNAEYSTSTTPRAFSPMYIHPYSTVEPKYTPLNNRPVINRGNYNVRVDIHGQGVVVGTTDRTMWTGREFKSFLGIKYAHVGKHEKRFQKADPVRAWSGEFNATKKPSACPSFPNLNIIRHDEKTVNVEDCLSLSVHTPDLDVRNPVMLYIHGEFFFDGNSQEARPHYLLEKDIVLVSVEYRLAPFGFLSTLTERMPGNVAVTDVVQALEWVQRYIHFFGGDSRRVTVFGQGAGATMAHVLTISPYVAPNLFHRVILQSGTALNPYFLTSDPMKSAKDIAKKASCKNETPDDIADCLSNLSTSEILRAFLRHCQENEPLGVGNYGGFQLSIGDFYGVLPKEPFKLITGANYSIIGGVTENVGSFYYSKIFPYLQRSNRNDIDTYIDIVLKHTIGEVDQHGIWKTFVARQLLNDYEIEKVTPELLSPGLIDLVSNLFYRAPLLKALQQNVKFGHNGTYLYVFKYAGKHKRYRFASYPFNVGVTLSDDNIYLFPYPEYVASLDDEDTRVAKTMIDLWTSFAETGIPVTTNMDEWPHMHLLSGPFLEIRENLDVVDDFVHEFNAMHPEIVNWKAKEFS